MSGLLKGVARLASNPQVQGLVAQQMNFPQMAQMPPQGHLATQVNQKPSTVPALTREMGMANPSTQLDPAMIANMAGMANPNTQVNQMATMAPVLTQTMASLANSGMAPVLTQPMAGLANSGMATKMGVLGYLLYYKKILLIIGLVIAVVVLSLIISYKKNC
tara:strand:+ start:8411 stop:8896 length:486 start_codon:yes stop_codon:yes gene_type:complete